MKQEEKLEEAKRLYKDANADQRYVLESLFPELVEIEDVRIRKRIIQALHGDVLDMEETTKAIAWLEKQNSKVANKEYWRGYREGKQEILDKYAELEKQGMQKTVWSEEDESILQGIWDEILANKHNAKEYEWKTYDKFLDWLKSLKDRIT